MIKKINKSTKIKIISILIIVTVVICGEAVIYNRNHDEECGNTAANFVVGQWVAENQNYYYYTDEGICQVNKAGEMKRIVDSPSRDGFSTITYINATKDALYYVKRKDDRTNQIIQRKNKDGKEKVLYQTKELLGSLQVVGNTVYFSTVSQAYRIKEGQTMPEPLKVTGVSMERYLQLLYVKGWSPIDWNVKLIYQTEKGQIHGNWMYVYKEEADIENKKWELYRVQSNGEKEEKLGENILTYNVTDDCIYYAQKEKTFVSIYKMSYNGTRKTKLLETSFKGLGRMNVTSDKMFFWASKDGELYERYWMNTSGDGLKKLEG